MSRRTTMEYVGSQRRAYAQLKSKAKKSQYINSLCQAFGFDRKYAIKLLTGNRKYKDPKRRGKTYSDKAVELFKRVWYATEETSPVRVGKVLKSTAAWSGNESG